MTNEATQADRQTAIGLLMLDAYDRGHDAALLAESPNATCPSPLSGEWGGESMPELLGRFVYDHEVADEYEARFTAGWDAGIEFRKAQGR